MHEKRHVKYITTILHFYFKCETTCIPTGHPSAPIQAFLAILNIRSSVGYSSSAAVSKASTVVTGNTPAGLPRTL